MSEKLPYEDDLNKQAGDLPLPDIDHSWQKMEAMLNEDKRRRTIIPYFRYAIWGLLCLAVAGGSWYFISTNTTKKDPTFSEAHQAQSDSQTSNTAAAGNSTKSDKELAGIENSTAKPQSNKTRESNITRDKAPDASIQTTTKYSNSNHIPKDRKQIDLVVADKVNPSTQNHTTPVIKDKNIKANQQPAPNLITDPSMTSLSVNSSANANKLVLGTNNITPQAASAAAEASVQQNIDSADQNIQRNSTATDSLPVLAKNMVGKDSSVAIQNFTKISKANNRIVFSAGIGIQQQIPIAGQSTSRYNDNGAANVLKDYIPAVYAQAQKGKWNLQAAFKYAGAQYVMQNSFYQQTRYEPSNKTTVQNSSVVQKIYYHQLPISINYAVLRNLTVGGGGMFNWLHSTIIENKTTVSDAASNNLISQNEYVNAVKAYTDSFFYASPFSVLLQTEYQFKQLSFGLRYSWSVQPYMKYTTPQGEINSKYFQTLQLMIRLRLWQSRANTFPRN